MSIFRTILLGAALAGTPSQVIGQDTHRGGWGAHLGGAYERLDGDSVPGSDWIELRGGLSRRFSGGGLTVEGIRARRFEVWDMAGAVEVSHRLWKDASGSVRAQFAPDPEVLPGLDLAVELYQALGQGFQASVGYRHMEFDTAGAGIRSFGLVRQTAQWFLAGRLSVLPLNGDTMATVIAASVRRHGRDAVSFLELTGAMGTEPITSGLGPVFEVVDTRRVLLRAQRAVASRFRLFGTVGFTHLDGLPDRITGSLGIGIE